MVDGMKFHANLNAFHTFQPINEVFYTLFNAYLGFLSAQMRNGPQLLSWRPKAHH